MSMSFSLAKPASAFFFALGNRSLGKHREWLESSL